jgi:hypothetical protein
MPDLLSRLRRRGLRVELAPDGDITVAGDITDRATASAWLTERAHELRLELLAERYASSGIVAAAKLVLGGVLTIRNASGATTKPRVRFVD